MAARKKLTDAQNKLANFKAKHQIADLQQQITQYLQQRTDVESRLIAQGRVLEAQQRQDVLKQLLDTIPATVTTSATGGSTTQRRCRIAARPVAGKAQSDGQYLSIEQPCIPATGCANRLSLSLSLSSRKIAVG